MRLIDVTRRSIGFVTDLFTPVGTIFLIVFLLVYAGVVLPAVWSQHPYRRSAASRMLDLMLRHTHQVLRAIRRQFPGQ
ncbi:hypothetical protein ACFXKS_11955 [Streptomyces scopuliridis]|uniref:hypothetical protein n=1 Tax=Streptomyces scopuliridis TaxID=452529 RepID=UPI0036A92A54